MDSPSLVELADAMIVRGGAAVIRDFTWTVSEGEAWAVVGPVGSGKTTLAETLLGRHHLAAGTIAWPILERSGAAWPSEVIQLVSFKEDSWRFSYGRHYYQERFNFSDPHDDLTLAEFLGGDVQAARQFGIEELLPLSFLKLSNGQVRRARL